MRHILLYMPVNKLVKPYKRLKNQGHIKNDLPL